MKLATQRDTAARDIQLAVGAFAAGAVLTAVGGLLQIPAVGAGLPRWLFFVVLAVMCVGLGLRRVAPVAGLAVALIALLADVALGGSLAGVVVFSQALYEMCVHGPPWLWRWTLRVSIIITIAAAVLGVVLTRSWGGLTFATPFALVFVLSVVSAISVRQYRDQAAAERARAEQTARLAELDRRQAVTAERTRMARELHDLIANHLSAVAIHATALLSVRDLDRGATEQSLRVIRSSSVQGLAEMREMVSLLRDPAGGGIDLLDADPADAGVPADLAGRARDRVPRVESPVRLREADQLVARARQAGLNVTMNVTGTARALTHDVDLAAYRILQESLTNALKHGDGQVQVGISYDPLAVCLNISNPVSSAALPVAGSGSGLIGMRERADLLGGELTAARTGNAWVVRALLPTAGKVAAA